MTRPEIDALVIKTLSEVAPEVASGSLVRTVPLRDQVDLDSFDFLNFVIALHNATGVEVPESDYARLTTLNDIVEYLAAHLPA